MVHSRAAVANGVQIAGVYDPDGARASQLAADLGARPFASVPAALETHPEVVLITSPPAVHAEQTIAALRAGSHVILEKPISLDLQEARAIGAVAAETGRRIHVCQQQRYSLAATRAKAALAGRKVALAHIWLYRQAPDIRANWDRDWGGGHIVEWAIHPLDFCRYVIGDVESVFAAYTDQILSEKLPHEPGKTDWRNWDAYSCTLRFACGAVGSVATSYAAPPGLGGGFGLDIVAEDLILRWRGTTLEIQTPAETTVYAEPGDPTVELHRAFYAALHGDASGIRLEYDDAVETLATVLACNRSNETGGPVRVKDSSR